MLADPVETVVIVGGGTAGWTSAAALTKVMPALKVVLVESQEIGIVGVGEATIPPITFFNAMLEVEEDDFVRATQATYKLGMDLQHLWLKVRSEGDETPHRVLSIAHRENVGMINLGLVKGDTQTHLPWDSWERPYTLLQPVAWFHDLMHPDGEPCRPREAEIFRSLSASKAGANVTRPGR